MDDSNELSKGFHALIKLSANLGFLWQELSLVEGIHAAAEAGFDAVECHWPFDVPADDIKQTLKETGLPMLSLNTLPGDMGVGDFGVCAIPDREEEARQYIEQAVTYAVQIDAHHVHVMSGKIPEKLLSQGVAETTLEHSVEGPQGEMESSKSRGVTENYFDTYLRNLNYAADLAAEHDIGILIEPINRLDIPGYYLSDIETAVEIVVCLSRPNIKILFDCYHIQVAQGNLMNRLEQYLEYIKHIQIAAVPTRLEPDEGEVCYSRLLRWLYESGYSGYIGAEYKPRTTTEAGLGWIDLLRH